MNQDDAGGMEDQAISAFRERFGRSPDVVASAPGRVNLIGEHTDYNQGWVLPCAVPVRVAVALAPGQGRLYSVDFADEQPLTSGEHSGWAARPRAVVWALEQGGHHVPSVDAVCAGNVPVGAGVSSSAAIEAAMALALDMLTGVGLDRRGVARLCQHAENGYLGVQSGIMDQLISLLGRPGHALLIDCRTLETTPVPMALAAHGLSLLVCDTHVKRELAGTAYNQRRQECEEASRELHVESLRDARPEDVARLPDVLRRRALHVVTENERVLAAVRSLEHSDFVRFGHLMYESHRSLREDFEVSGPELDLAVDTARAQGALGARLTGAGFGGCAIALVRDSDTAALGAALIDRFSAHGFKTPTIHHWEPAEGATVRHA